MFDNVLLFIWKMRFIFYIFVFLYINKTQPCHISTFGKCISVLLVYPHTFPWYLTKIHNNIIISNLEVKQLFPDHFENSPSFCTNIQWWRVALFLFLENRISELLVYTHIWPWHLPILLLSNLVNNSIIFWSFLKLSFFLHKLKPANRATLSSVWTKTKDKKTGD